MKKIRFIQKAVYFIVSCCILMTAVTGYAVEEPMQLQEEQFITRFDCLERIMKMIGWHELPNSGSADLVVFGDVSEARGLKCTYYAKRSSIAFGEMCYGVYYPRLGRPKKIPDFDIVFYPDRNVTVKEAIAFMVRCLGQHNEYALNVDYCWEMGKQKDLVMETDDFKADDQLTEAVFEVLSERFLDSRRCKYYDEENLFGVDIKAKIDKEGLMTYREYLEQLNQSSEENTDEAG